MKAYNTMKEWVLLLLVNLGQLSPEEANILMEKKKISQKFGPKIMPNPFGDRDRRQ